MKTFPVPTAGSGPNEITLGPDGNLWFTEYFGDKIGRVTPAGRITEFPVPTANSRPYGITSGPDGNLWFTEYGAATIGRITPSGTITEFQVGTPTELYTITSAAGALWFTEYSANAIGRITTEGTVSQFPLPTGPKGPYAITLGGDGNLWYTRTQPVGPCDLVDPANTIGRMTTQGAVREFRLPHPDSRPYSITAGNGVLWFAECAGNRIGRITTAGTIHEYPLPKHAGVPLDVAVTNDNRVWFTEYLGKRLGQLKP
jgi:virginiamycin B lyase